ncbi:MAG: uncharacterized protein KVP18_002056 [Porospora cf. gigantea A]|uniref:uncharacterized protein n=1 Tax=Porospora cf. gigantea A TaxID=2853593 RepID=UPI0035595980|nr:MAG: hypothetical protein KVP18_002056 [Porospora cf. gigantea A]
MLFSDSPYTTSVSPHIEFIGSTDLCQCPEKLDRFGENGVWVLDRAHRRFTCWILKSHWEARTPRPPAGYPLFSMHYKVVEDPERVVEETEEVAAEVAVAIKEPTGENDKLDKWETKRALAAERRNLLRQQKVERIKASQRRKARQVEESELKTKENSHKCHKTGNAVSAEPVRKPPKTRMRLKRRSLVEAEGHAQNMQDAQRMRAQPVEAQPVEAHPVEAQPVEAQPAEAQPVEAQPVEAQPVEVHECYVPDIIRLLEGAVTRIVEQIALIAAPIPLPPAEARCTSVTKSTQCGNGRRTRSWSDIDELADAVRVVTRAVAKITKLQAPRSEHPSSPRAAISSR